MKQPRSCSRAAGSEGINVADYKSRGKLYSLLGFLTFAKEGENEQLPIVLGMSFLLLTVQ